MKKLLFATVLISAFFCFTAFQCNENEDEDDFENEKSEISTMQSQIINLANSSICNDTTICKYIGFGSKACGGPKSYLIYSTSIKTDSLELLVKTYNEQEAAFNKKWGIISDCSIVNPPTDLICENNTCKAVY
ncbi:hypothetical protein [Neotamlana laminarinivorans]|uniref:Lipoprotein n=1 Tax=Neotamlana laminarinivorans TaxID=2883124 RepID=A0A9X1HYF2_9FLAO|nr:hypothetical protein [Tamlana laminarinivorans]MCB4798424.1 hypothetical protein [Tamlana laminarinivorans]